MCTMRALPLGLVWVSSADSVFGNGKPSAAVLRSGTFVSYYIRRAMPLL